MNQLERLNGLFHEYFEANVKTAEKSDEAFANEVFDMTTSDGQRYFLKVLKKQHPEAIVKEVEMQQLLLRAGIRTPEYLELKLGEYVGQHNGERFLLSRYLPGSSPKTVTLKLMHSFGVTLARIHDALKEVQIPDNEMQWLNPNRVKSDVSTYHGDVKDDLDTLLTRSFPLFDKGLPTAITHGDLWLSNVFADNDEITTVFDLETAERAPRIVDIARTYTSLRFNSSYNANQVVNELVNGYNTTSAEKLLPQEINRINQAIVYVCGACATWHAVHGTRYRDPYIQLGYEASAKI
jgi:Ser/Thr protein kinase RdoA (MazF antagonist)